MKPWRTLAAGAALILLANAVALVGVYLNRSGEPDARMLLTQRELTTPWVWQAARENSGIALALNWRVPVADAADYFDPGYGYSGGTPEWLDEERMKALGFDLALVGDEAAARRRFERQLPRDVLVVLELGGDAWQQALQRARQNAARHEAARLANADSKQFVERAKRAQEQLQHEEQASSRLFAIDAGLDRAALRARYPDRGRFLILRATLRPRLENREGKTRVAGYVSGLAATQINLPHALRPALEPALREARRSALDPGARFELTLAVGQRLEPWVEAVSLTR